jgi:hypothetical protein
MLSGHFGFYGGEKELEEWDEQSSYQNISVNSNYYFISVGKAIH